MALLVLPAVQFICGLKEDPAGGLSFPRYYFLHFIHLGHLAPPTAIADI